MARRNSSSRNGATKPTVIIACAVAEKRLRWAPSLQERFAICEVSERGALEHLMGYVHSDALVLDLCLPGLGRLQALRGIRARSPSTKILVLAERPSDAESVAALEAGAKGYFSRDIEPAQLCKAIEALQRGEIWIRRRVVNALVATLMELRERTPSPRPMVDRRLSTLTPRERQVAELIAQGASNKDIARRLNISERTVKSHLTELFRDLKVSDRLKLALTLNGGLQGEGAPALFASALSNARLE